MSPSDFMMIALMFVSRSFFAITLVLINLNSRPAFATSDLDQDIRNTSSALDVWFSDIQLGYDEIIKSCMDLCSEEDTYFRSVQAIGCGSHKDLCSAGCSRWKAATNSNCQIACNNSTSDNVISPSDLSCISGCNQAVSSITDHMQEFLDLKIPPVLSDTGADGTYLILTWPVEEEKCIIDRLGLQRRYVDDSTRWAHSSNVQWFENCTSVVSELTPYTNYTFRVTMTITNDSRFIHFAESEVFQTLPTEELLEPLEITKVMTVDYDKIAVLWKPRPAINSSVKYSVIAEHSGPDEYFSIETVVVPSGNYVILHPLKPNLAYDIVIKMTASNRSEYHKTMRQAAIDEDFLLPTDREDTLINKFIAASWRTVQLCSVSAQNLTCQSLYTSDYDILDFDASVSGQIGMIADSSGLLYKINLTGSNFDREALAIPNAVKGTELLKISVDWTNDRVYMALEFHNEETSRSWEIFQFRFPFCCKEPIAKGLSSKPISLKVDPFSGYLFWLSDTGVFRLNRTDNSWNQIYHQTGLTAFTIDPSRLFLTAFSTMNRKFIKITYDGRYTFDEDHFGSLADDVLDVYSQDSSLYWIDRKFLHSNQMKVRLSDAFQILIPYVDRQAICPKETVSNLRALLAADHAKLYWDHAQLGYLQVKSHSSYELEVKTGEESNTIRDIWSTIYTVKNLQRNTEYWFRVRSYCSSKDDRNESWSEWIQRKTTAASGIPRRLAWATKAGLLLTSEVGDTLEVLSNRSIDNFAWVNNTIYTFNDSKLDRLEDLDTDIRGVFSVGSIAYDWRGQKLYYADKAKNIVVRSTLDGISREFLPIFGAKQLVLDPDSGHMYYSTELEIEGCSLDGLRCTTYFKKDLYSEVYSVGPAIDLNGGRVFWITQVDHGSRGELLSQQLLGRQDLKEDLLPVVLEDLPVDNWLAYSSGRLIWPTTENSIVFADIVGDNQYNVGECDSIGTISYGVASVDGIDKLQSDTADALIPEAVNSSTVRISGLWNDFNITWQPLDPVLEHKVWYSLRLGDRFIQTEIPTIRYLYADLPPYSRLRIWITSHSSWHTGPTTMVELFSPSATPSEPRHLRVFIDRVHNPLQNGQNISAVVRWEPPAEPNGPIILYTVTCHMGEELVSIQNSTDTESTFWDLEENITYVFQARAFTSGSGGNTSEAKEITMDVQFQSLPKLLVALETQITVLDMDVNTTEVVAQTTRSAKFLATIREEKLVVWVDRGEQLMLLHEGNVSVLSTAESEVQALTIDWISRVVYWAQRDSGGGSTIHYLDLNQHFGEPLRGSLLISNPNSIKDLVMLPMSRTLFWLELDGTISGWNLQNLTELNLFLGTNLTFRSLYPACFENGKESLLLVEEDGTICLLDLRSETCKPLKIGTDLINLHLAWDNGFVYSLKNQSIRAYNRRKQVLEYMVNVEGISYIAALTLQPYPERKCLLSDYDEEPLAESNLLVPQLVNSTENSLALRFPRIPAPPHCEFQIPGLKYTLFVMEHDSELRSFDAHLNVTKLKPFTRYTVQLGVSSYYADQLGIPMVLGPEVNFITAPGTPSQPRNITVYAVSPRDGLLEWMPPEVLNNDKVWYEIHWRTETQNNGAVHRFQEIIPETEDEWSSFLLSSLRPNQTYAIWMKVYSTRTAFNQTSEFYFKTFSEPGDLTFVNSTAYNMTLSWNPSQNVTSVFLLYSPQDVDDAVSVNITGNTQMRLVESLEPKTKYSFQLKLFYSYSLYPYVWPPDNRFVFETLADCPTAPGVPLIEHIKGEVYRIFWESAKNNGAEIELYSLEALKSVHVKRVRRSHYYAQDKDRQVSNKTLARLGQLPWAEELEPIQDKWIPHWNGTDTSCIITDLHTKRLLMFRVRAKNSFGWGPYSLDSEMIAEPFILPRKRDTLVFAIIAPITIVSTCVSMIMLFRYVHARRRHAKKVLYESRPSIWGLDVATLQQVARSRNISQTSSILYTGKPLTDGDIALLPQISRSQITMQKFLGSGAFGEVYEGLVTYSEDLTQDRVAIKTLRKGASDQEKTELLQEAHLMSHFKHENIVKLIGVCFDLDSICIIMELMEGGDLQTFLRQARPNLTKRGTLSLLDLIGMCLDVCTGCRYLEDLHFLHRDLACRNCLVSSMDSEYRVVKIGDFGLARDIYKSDYYRKEGEGLLPVRWMAPECLVDGVFTSQSDIWSFGILLWEILSLGQQPYPAQSNLEVLNFVKEGGRLQQPDRCPVRLYKLMLQCWRHSPEDRPTFQQCLNELLAMKLEALNIKHSKDYEGGVTNKSYAASDDESISKLSISSGDRRGLNKSNIDQLQSDQRKEGTRELTSFKGPTSNEADISQIQPKRKSVHYVNEARSKV